MVKFDDISDMLNSGPKLLILLTSLQLFLGSLLLWKLNALLRKCKFEDRRLVKAAISTLSTSRFWVCCLTLDLENMFLLVMGLR